jgi:two-component system NtrC family sensor kinase
MAPEGGSITIELLNSPSGEGIGIAIADTGPGIPPENRQKLFEPFYTTKPHGLGLGLSICYEIVERHHGRIEVNSRPGEGAIFTVWLPLTPPQERAVESLGEKRVF